MAYLFSVIMYRLDSYLIAIEGFSVVGLDVKPALALEALTKDSDNTEEHRAEQIQFQRGMGKNYERLEFIGDCFLKMATSITLFSISPDDNEFEYHVRRMLMICNSNLLKTAIDYKLYEYIRDKAFSRLVQCVLLVPFKELTFAGEIGIQKGSSYSGARVPTRLETSRYRSIGLATRPSQTFVKL